MLYEQNLERHFVCVLRFVFMEQPRDCVRELVDQIVERRILKCKSGNVRRSDEPHACLSISADNYLVFHSISLAGKRGSCVSRAVNASEYGASRPDSQTAIRVSSMFGRLLR